MPEAGIGFGKSNASLDCTAPFRAQEHDAAILLLLRQRVRQQ